MNQVFWPFAPKSGFSNLLRCPFIIRVGGNGRIDNHSGGMFNDHKYIEWFEKDSVNRREITAQIEENMMICTPF